MRLIDADKLEDDGVNYSYEQSENFGVIKTEYRFVNRFQIDKLPTVQAIPIEWIRQWCNKSENTYSKADVIEMLNDWEKENEADRQE